MKLRVETLYVKYHQTAELEDSIQSFTQHSPKNLGLESLVFQVCVFSFCWKCSWYSGLYQALGRGNSLIILSVQKSLGSFFCLWWPGIWLACFPFMYLLSPACSFLLVIYLSLIFLRILSFCCFCWSPKASALLTSLPVIAFRDLAHFCAVGPRSDYDMDWMLCWYDLALFCSRVFGWITNTIILLMKIPSIYLNSLQSDKTVFEQPCEGLTQVRDISGTLGVCLISL